MYLLLKIYKKAVCMKSVTILFAFITFLSSSVAGMLILEPETFSPFSALWWTMTTATTVGYGDISPVTLSGQLFTMLYVYPIGIGLLGVVISKIFDSMIRYQKLKGEGKLTIKEKNHIVFIGWANGKTLNAIEEALTHEENFVVLIDRNLNKAPYEHERFQFVLGSATDETTLEKANILHALSVGIFAPHDIDDIDLADGRTYLVASTIEQFGEKHGKNIYTIAEIISDKHEELFKRAGINECIPSYQTVSNLMAKSIEYHGTSNFFMQLLSKRYGNDLHQIQSKSDWNTYEDARKALLEHGAILIANEKEFLTENLDRKIPIDTKLSIICNSETHKKIM